MYFSSLQDGGLYDKLYLCLFYTVTELTKLSHSTNTKQSAIKSKLNTLWVLQLAPIFAGS